jgi:hypothetical protein
MKILVPFYNLQQLTNTNMEWIFMKAFLTTILGLACLILLFFGNLHWQDKINHAGDNAIESASAKEVQNAEKTEEIDQDKILEHASNWSAEEKQKLQSALSEGRPYRILLAGSSSLGEGENSWPALFQEEMIRTFGEQVITINIKSYTETSKEFVESNAQTDFIEGKYDLIIWEPFTLTDNGTVVIETSHNYILSVIEEVTAADGQTDFILQPPNPIFQPSFYQLQVNSLEAFAQKHGLPYLNHWTAWPDTDSEEILNYIDDEKQPNDLGHQVWADFLIDQFISK